MRTRLLLCVSLGLLPAHSLLWTSPASCQGVDFAAGTGWYTLTGEEFDATDAGVGLDGSLRFWVSGPVQMGVGFHWNSHDVRDVDENASVAAIFIEPRISALSASEVAVPFLGVRLGMVNQSLIATVIDLSRTGAVIGVVGGSLFRLTPRVALEAGLVFNHYSFGEVDLDGEAAPGTKTTAHSVGFRIGLNLTAGG